MKNKYFYPLSSDTLRNKDLVEANKVLFSKQLNMSKVTKIFEDVHLFFNPPISNDP